MSKSFIINHLQSHEVKPSEQRIAVMQYLMEHRTHPTADTIYNDLASHMPTLSKTTVYNTLNLLVQKGAIMQIDIDERNARFDGDPTPHAHFKCKKCGHIYDLPIDTSVINKIIFSENKEKLIIEETYLYYKGYCSICIDTNIN